MRGHEEASGTNMYPELFELWEKKDPVTNFEQFLLAERVITEEEALAIRDNIKRNIEEELALSEKEAAPVIINTEIEVDDVYFAHQQNEELLNVDENNVSEKRFIEAIKEGLYQSLKEYDDLIIMGQDIAEYGGAFK